MNFGEFCSQYQEEILPLKKPSTVASFNGHLNLFKKQFGKRTVQELSYIDIQKFLSALSKDKTPKTVKNIWVTLRCVLTHAKRSGLIVDVPQPVLKKVSRPEQEWLTPVQMSEIANISGDDESFFYFLAESGVRVGEALGLKAEDIDFEERTISISRSLFGGLPNSPKTDSSNRHFAASRRLCFLLEKTLCGRKEGWVWTNSKGNPNWPGEVLKVLHSLCTRIGIKPVGFHAFRRGNITLCDTIGMPEGIIAQRVGHKPAGITLGLYRQKYEGADKPWIEKIERALSRYTTKFP